MYNPEYKHSRRAVTTRAPSVCVREKDREREREGRSEESLRRDEPWRVE